MAAFEFTQTRQQLSCKITMNGVAERAAALLNSHDESFRREMHFFCPLCQAWDNNFDHDFGRLGRLHGTHHKHPSYAEVPADARNISYIPGMIIPLSKN